MIFLSFGGILLRENCLIETIFGEMVIHLCEGIDIYTNGMFNQNILVTHRL